MDDNGSPVDLDTPVTGDEDSSGVVQVKQPTISPADEIAAARGAKASAALVNAQPKVRIRVPKVMGPQVVIINGARWNVPANVFVDVPQQVAEILQDAGRI